MNSVISSIFDGKEPTDNEDVELTQEELQSVDAIAAKRAEENAIKEAGSREAYEAKEALTMTVEQLEELYSPKSNYNPHFPKLFRWGNRAVSEISNQEEAQSLMDQGLVTPVG